jgi:hypothetical protein
MTNWKIVSGGLALAVLAGVVGAAGAQYAPYTIATVTGNELVQVGPKSTSPQYVYDGSFRGGHNAPPTGSTSPALTSCGTSPSDTGTDGEGTVTMGTGSPTGCVITFVKAFVTAPNCTVTWQATPLASQSYAVSATAITLTQTATSSNVANWVCRANVGG